MKKQRSWDLNDLAIGSYLVIEAALEIKDVKVEKSPPHDLPHISAIDWAFLKAIMVVRMGREQGS